MAQYHRILWSEGLFITPHHFQQWDIFQDAQLADRISATRPFSWGVYSMQIDTENLARGTFRLLEFRGIFPAGGAVRVPDFDPPPESVEFGEAFDIKNDTFEIFLGIPARRSGWPNTKLNEDSKEGGEELRYHAKSISVPDENTGRDERTVQRAEQNLRILLETDLRDNYECIPIAQVQRNATGEFQLVEEFVPPLLSVQASPYVMQVCRGLLERLSSRSTQLAGRFTDSGVNTKDITPANLRAFLQLSALNTMIPQLVHVREVVGSHPEDFYKIFAGLVGQLCTFNPAQYHPRDIPGYNHTRLGPIFKQMEVMVVELLDIKGGGVTHGYDVIGLTAAGDGRLTGNINKESHIQPTTALILSIGGNEINDADLLGSLPQFIVTSQDRIDQKMSLNLPGLAMNHLTMPPPAIPRQQGTYYFQLANQGNDYDAICENRNLAIQVPLNYRSCKIELLALEGGR